MRFHTAPLLVLSTVSACHAEGAPVGASVLTHDGTTALLQNFDPGGVDTSFDGRVPIWDTHTFTEPAIVALRANMRLEAFGNQGSKPSFSTLLGRRECGCTLPRGHVD